MLHSPAPMHIPDGFLSLAVSVICWIVTAALIAVAVARLNRTLDDRQVPLMGVMAAFIFAAQMINFPVAGGTSGHLLGGTLAAILLGPWSGMLVMTAVIAVQGLLFQDGGLLAMGANILNMGILSVTIGYGLYRLVLGRPRRLRLAGAGVAAWFSVMTGALATALQIWLSGNAKPGLIFPAMLGVHALIGIGEGLITAATLAFIFRVRPDLVEEKGIPRGGGGWAHAGLLIALVIAVLSPLASTDPDGLERVAVNLGFIRKAQPNPFSIIPDYTLPFLGPTPLSTILAGVLGVLVVAGLVFLTVRLLRKRN